MIELQGLALTLLREPLAAMRHAGSRAIGAVRSSQHVLATDEHFFRPLVHAHDGLAKVEVADSLESDWDHRWDSADKPIVRELKIGWARLTWKEHALEVFELGYLSPFGQPVAHRWLVADTAEVAQQYFREVCQYNDEVRDEVLVFANGCWNKSPALFKSVQAARWEDVVLAGDLAEKLRGDFDRFLAARADYERWGVPWKRGALFLGPPGNGKTLTIRALVRHLARPCLYVQSFASKESPEQVSIREVFSRARGARPRV